MSENRINRTIQDLESRIRGTNSSEHKIILISDSKGCYLRNQSFNIKGCPHITWLCKRGATLKDTYNWLKATVQRDERKFSNAQVYLWMGTCDLTTKSSNRCIELVNKYSRDIDYILTKYIEIRELLERANSIVTFIDVPLYSIRHWNRAKGHPHPEAFVPDDELLRQQIQELNNNLQRLNQEKGLFYPNLNIDLTISRSKNHRTEYHTNWKLFLDGIHPKPIVAKVWLLKLIHNSNKK